MQITPNQQNSGIAEAAKAAPNHAAAPAQTHAAHKKDTAIFSQGAKDLAAQLSGKQAQEEAKESPVVEAQEEQGKSKH